MIIRVSHGRYQLYNNESLSFSIDTANDFENYIILMCSKNISYFFRFTEKKSRRDIDNTRFVEFGKIETFLYTKDCLEERRNDVRMYRR